MRNRKSIDFKFPVDEELNFYLHDCGVADGLYSGSVVQELLYQAQREAAESDAGRELREILLASGRPATYLVERIAHEVQKRWGTSILMPGVATRARCEEVLQDLVTELKPLVPKPKPAPPAPKVNLSQDEKPSSAITFFALMFNFADRESPASTLKPKAGIITLTDPSTQKKYEYPVKRFDELYEQAVKFNLIDRPHQTILRSF